MIKILLHVFLIPALISARVDRISPRPWAEIRAGIKNCRVIIYIYVFVTLPYGFLGQVWYLIVSIPDLCLLPYFLFMYISSHYLGIKYFHAIHSLLHVLDSITCNCKVDAMMKIKQTNHFAVY